MTHQPPHIAVTGPACSGKTTLVHTTAGLLRKQGFRVVVAEEAASRIIFDAAPDIAELHGPQCAAVQAAMLRHMRDQRHTFGQLASELGAAVVLHDRCELDAVPYNPVPGLEEVLAERGETTSSLRDAYRFALFCEPAPVYETASNPARYEEAAEAAARAAALRDVYDRNLRVLDVPWSDTARTRAVLVADILTEELTRQQ